MSDEFVEKDGKKGLIIMIVVLVLVVLGLGGYIVYDNFLSEKDEEVVEEKEEKEESEVRELSASEVEEYIEKAEIYNRLLYKHFLIKSEEEISNDAALFFAYVVLSIKQKDVTAENVSNVLVDYFGEKHGYKLDNIKCLGMDEEDIYVYDKENNIYVLGDHGGHGGLSIVSSNIRYVSSKVEGNKVTLVTKVLYERACGDTCGPTNAYYSSVDGSYNDDEPVLGDASKDEELVLTDELFDSVSDKLPTTTYNFIVEESGNFYLDRVSIDK